METITLQYTQAIKEKLMKFLETFPKKDLEIIVERSGFDQVKEELQKDYEYSKSPDAIFYTTEELEKLFDEEGI